MITIPDSLKDGLSKGKTFGNSIFGDPKSNANFNLVGGIDFTKKADSKDSRSSSFDWNLEVYPRQGSRRRSLSLEIRDLIRQRAQVPQEQEECHDGTLELN